MRKDDLEKFIEANRAKWDDQKAPEGIWDRIENDLDQPIRARNSWKLFSIFLAVTLLSILSYFLITNSSGNMDNNQEEVLEFAEVEDFKETEHFYLSSIQVSYEKLNLHGIDATLESDLTLLDSNYKELIEEYKLAQGAYREQVLRAIIQNHKTKLEILERVLLDVELSKNVDHERVF